MSGAATGVEGLPGEVRHSGAGDSNPSISIITPTHNRADLLVRLYRSLRAQTRLDFEWLVVDDASADDTPALVQSFEDDRFSVHSWRLSAGGKHRAVNYAVARAASPLVFIVDDDDWLPKDSVEIILEFTESHPAGESVCSYSFLRAHADGTVNGGAYPVDVCRSSYVQGRINAGILGDRAEVHTTSALRAFPFPEFEGEPFYPEDGVWVRMSERMDTYHVNKVVYISDYLEGGLTKSGRNRKLNSPLGMKDRAQAFLATREPVRGRTLLKMQVLWTVYGTLAGGGCSELFREAARKPLFLLTYLPSIWIAGRWRRERDCGK